MNNPVLPKRMGTVWLEREYFHVRQLRTKPSLLTVRANEAAAQGAVNAPSYLKRSSNNLVRIT